MKKTRILSLTLVLLLMFGSILPYPASAVSSSKANNAVSQISKNKFKEKVKKSQVQAEKKNISPVSLKKKAENPLETKLKNKANKKDGNKEKSIPNELIIKYKTKTDSSKIQSLHKKFSFHPSKTLKSVNAEVVKIPKGKTASAMIKELKKDPTIESVQPNYKYFASEINNAPNYYDQLWGIHNTGQVIKNIPGIADIDVDAKEARASYAGKLSQVVVGVIDTGVDISHPDLKDIIWTNPGEAGAMASDGIDNDKNGYVDDVHGWDFYNNDNTVYDPLDGDEHGTHVSGTIAAVMEGTANKGVVGVAPNVKILPIKFLGPWGGTTSDAILAIEYAKSMGIKITNNSWGGGEYDPLLEEAINNSNSLFVAAAGNDGMNNDMYQSYPSSFESPNILSVAALDNMGNLADFSNYGFNSVDVAAPGVNILSTVPKFPDVEIASALGLENLGASAQITNTEFNFKAVFDGIGYEKIKENQRSDAFDKALSFLDIPKDQTKKILLVQDDEHDIAREIPVPELQEYFKDYLPTYESLLEGYNYEVLSLDFDSSLIDSGVDLSLYDAVVWFTGHGLGIGTDEGTTLTSADIDTLSNYLSSGGRLLLTGQDAIYGHEFSPFVQELLSLNVYSDLGPNLNVSGLPGGIYEGLSYEVDRFESPYPFADFIQSNGPSATVNLNYVSEYKQAYDYYNGTSMATPHVTGVAALFAGLYPKMSPELTKLYLSHKGKEQPNLNGLINSGKLVKASKLNTFDDNNFPGTPLVKNILNGSVNVTTDKDDVYAVALKEGEVLNLSLTGQAGTDFDLYLYDSSAADISNAGGMVGYSETANTSKESIKFTAPATGVYFIDVYAFKNAGSYKLSAGNFAGSYEDDSDALSYWGNWSYIEDPTLSKGTASVLNSQGEVNFSFVGYSFEWQGFKNYNQGVADVYIDGVKLGSPSLYSSSFKAKERIYRKDYSSYGEHKVKIVWTGKTDASARKSAAGINIDRFIVRSNPVSLNVYYDTTKKHPVVSWNSVSWAASYDVYRKESTQTEYKKVNSTPVSAVRFNDTTAFPGKTYVYSIVINTKDSQETPMSTSFTYVYDDDTKGHINLSASTVKGSLNSASKDLNDVWSKQLEQGKTYQFVLTGPSSADFNLKLFKTGTTTIYGATPLKESVLAGSAEKVTFTPQTTGLYYLVPTAKSGAGQYNLSAAVQTTKRMENTDSNIKYTGTWSKISYSSASGGSIARANSTSSSLAYSFSGTSLKVYALKDTNMGLADIYIDGVKVKQVDLYASSRKYKVNVYEYKPSDNNNHTIKIVPTGKKNSASTGTYVNIDAFDLTKFTPLN